MRAFLSYSHLNETEAKTLHTRLEAEADIAVTWDAIDLPLFASPKTFMESVREHDAVVHLISRPFLESRNCMRELVDFMKDDTERNHYLERTVPIIIDGSDDHLSLFDTSGQLELVDYWMGKKRQLEEQIYSRSSDFGLAMDDLRGDIILFRDIAEHIVRFMRTVTFNIYAASFGSQQEKDFADVIRRLREISPVGPDAVTSEPDSNKDSHQGPSRRSRWSSPGPSEQTVETPLEVPQRKAVPIFSPGIEHLMDLRDSIVVASHSDPDRPEFPPFSPRFPATPAKRVHVPALDREIIVKDESHNFTGSHKDRMAWEIVVFYKQIIEDMLAPHSRTGASLPSVSIISNGSAAVAIQVMLRCFALPALKVLIDHETADGIVERLHSIGCEVYREDLSAKVLGSADVLELTDNRGGYDLTSRSLVDPTRRTYYDWLAYEIFSCGAKHIFIPVGTGDLFVNILNVLRDEQQNPTSDRRLTHGKETIEGLQLYGATSRNSGTSMDKLHAAHRPTLAEAERVVTDVREAGHCGSETKIYDVSESFVSEALSIARENRIKCDESGIAGLTLLLQLKEDLKIPTDEDIAIVNTGWLPLYTSV